MAVGLSQCKVFGHAPDESTGLHAQLVDAIPDRRGVAHMTTLNLLR